MKYIELTQNFKTLVDDDTHDSLNKYKWCVIKKRNKYYAGRGKWSNGKTKIIYLHKVLLETDKIIDHINGNTLDNRLENLRICTSKENARNQTKSKFKGVYKHKRLKTKPFSAKITVNYKHIHLGYFSTAINAAIAYNQAAIKYFGEFANLNKI